jgi:hypothetical protein
MEPFSPNAARVRHAEKIPDSIISIINELLAERVYNGVIEITQAELTEKITRKGHSEDDFIDRGWIHFEEGYRARGWQVDYSRPNGIGVWCFRPTAGK